MDEARHKKNFNSINLRDLFMDKNPKVGRWIPIFVFRALSRMLRIDLFNNPILYKHAYIIAEEPEMEFRYIKNESPTS